MSPTRLIENEAKNIVTCLSVSGNFHRDMQQRDQESVPSHFNFPNDKVPMLDHPFPCIALDISLEIDSSARRTKKELENEDILCTTKMLKSSAYPIQTTSYLELKSPIPNLNGQTTTEEQLSPSGESGYFDASYTDLQAFFDISEGGQEVLTVSETNAPVVTSVATPIQDDRMEWTYLEPVPVSQDEITSPPMTTSNLLSSTIRPMSLVDFPTTMPDESIDMQLLPTGPWTEPLVIKSEPNIDTYKNTSSQPSSTSSVPSIPQQHSDVPMSFHSVPILLSKRDSTQGHPCPPTNPNLSNTEPGFQPQQVSNQTVQVTEYYNPPPKRGRCRDGSNRANPRHYSSHNQSFPVEVRLCHVCGGLAGKHSYYGGQVCPSCRAFFRRSVQSKYCDVYTCSKNKNCVITEKTRKNCQFCRFHLCEFAGMKRSWVLADGERRNVKGGNKNMQGKNSKMERLPTEPIVPLPEQQMAIIRESYKTWQAAENETGDIGSEILSDIVDLVKRKKSSLSLHNIAGLRKVLGQREKLFALNIPAFMSLSHHDQNVLLSANLDTLVDFRLASAFRTGGSWRRQLELILGLGAPKVCKRLPGGIHYGKTSSTDETTNLEYKQFAGVENCSSSMQSNMSLNDYVSKISDWIEDNNMFTLFNLVILFKSSGLKLDNLASVDEIQVSFTHLLQRYLESIHGRSKARSKFTFGITRILHYIRELSEERRNQLTCNYDLLF